MNEVILKPLLHRGMECIGIYFEINYKIQGALRKTDVVKFSVSNKCWYAPLSKENYNKLFFVLKGLATIEQSALHQYLAAKKGNKPGIYKTPTVESRTIVPKKPSVAEKKQAMASPNLINKQVIIYKAQKIQAVNAHVLP